MPLMYAQNTLQMEWCLNCHRDPAKNLRPTSQIYNMAWDGPSSEKPVWCSVGDDKSGKPTAQSVNCATQDPATKGLAAAGVGGTGSVELVSASYTKFTSQRELGNYLIEHYKIRKPNELSSCEVCHR
jgi:hypothetical protein